MRALFTFNLPENDGCFPKLLATPNSISNLNPMRAENNEPYHQPRNQLCLKFRHLELTLPSESLNDIRSLSKRLSKVRSLHPGTTTQHRLNKEHPLGAHLNLLEISNTVTLTFWVLKRVNYQEIPIKSKITFNISNIKFWIGTYDFSKASLVNKYISYTFLSFSDLLYLESATVNCHTILPTAFDLLITLKLSC